MGTPNNGINGTLATGLLGHWDFDGTLEDSSGNGRHMTASDTVFAVDKDAESARALSLNQWWGNAHTPNITNISQFSVSIWFYYSGNAHPLLGVDPGEKNSFHFHMDAASRLILGEQYIADIVVGWNHLVILHNKLLVNNVLVNSGFSTLEASVKIEIENNYGEGSVLVDELRVYDRDITLSESNEIYEMGVNYVRAPVLTPDGGTYAQNQTVSITGESDDEIRYTLDGTEPISTSNLYESEIIISETLTIKAKAFKKGAESRTVTKNYIINKGGEGMDVGMPKLDIIFKGLGVSAVARGSKGVAILIIKDDTNKTFDFVTYRSYADLTSTESAKYTADNLQYIKDALDGTPLKLIVARMDVAGTLADMLVKIRGIAPRNCWIGMAAGTTVDHDAIVSWVKSERTNNKKCYKAVVFNATAPDSLAIVNFANTSVVFADARSTQTGEKGVATLLGFFAGLPLTMSGIGKPLSYKFSSVIEPADNEAAVNAGKLVLYSEDGAVKVARAINSLQTTGQDVTDDMKFIIIVEAMDMIFTDIYETWNNYFKGKYKNFMTNQLLLIGAINSYFTGLANDLILDPLYENKTAIDTEKQRLANIPKYGEDVVNAWDDNKVMLMTVGTNVYLKANVKILNAFEDMALSIYM